MNKKDRVYVAGHRGMVGSAILRRLQKEGFENFVLKTSTGNVKGELPGAVTTSPDWPTLADDRRE